VQILNILITVHNDWMRASLGVLVTQASQLTQSHATSVRAQDHIHISIPKIGVVPAQLFEPAQTED
jgi:hypothetical protein